MEDFFNEQTDSSRIKAGIVAEYFPQYCRILLKRDQPQIRYLDLFSGPGKYKDGSLSTPLLIAESCANDSLLARKVRLLFNDKQYSEELEKNFYEQWDKDTFNFEPRFGDKTVGEDERIKEFLSTPASGKNPHPTLLFFDPWGYKGIDTEILSKFLGHWGNEIFLFVNIKRIHAAIENDKFDDLMRLLFPTSFNEIKKSRKYKATVHERLSLIMENLAGEFEKAVGGDLYHCAFKFQEEDSKTTSHFIIHFTKHPKGYELVKQIYHEFDNIGAALGQDGNYTFDAKAMDSEDLDFGDTNVISLSETLQKEYKGKTVTALKLFREHNPKTQFSGKHYVLALRQLADDGMIDAKYTDSRSHRVKVLLIDDCKITFN